MTKSIDYRPVIRVALPQGMPSLPISTTARVTWLSRSQVGTVCAFRSVPSRLVDLLITEQTAPDMVLVCEVGRKVGKYDGAVRDRITLRWMRPDTVESWPEPPALAALHHASGDGVTSIRLTSVDGHTEYWSGSWAELRSDLSDYRCRQIVWWHANRYYPFLVQHHEQDVKALAESFTADPTASLADANREASRLLYELARCLGYRKLTLRERRRLGLEDHGQWCTEQVYAEQQSAYGRASGVSDWTDTAAHETIEDIIILRGSHRAVAP